MRVTGLGDVTFELVKPGCCFVDKNKVCCCRYCFSALGGLPLDYEGNEYELESRIGQLL